MSRRDDVSLWPPSFSAAIFDFDDTLALTHELWKRVDIAFLSSRGIPYTPDIAHTLSVLGFRGGAHYCIERYGLRDTPEEICAEWKSMGRALYAQEVELRPGARAYIEALRGRGVPTALATTNDAEVLAAIQDRIDFGDLFDVVVCAGDVSAGKDSPEIYLETARRLGVSPGDCMVFEDLLMAVATAGRAGFRTCAVLGDNPNQNPVEMRRCADVAISDWRDLVRP